VKRHGRALAVSFALLLAISQVAFVPVAWGREPSADRRADRDAAFADPLAVVPRQADRQSPVRQAYDLLLDRFALPLSSADLLNAAAQGALTHAAQARPGEWPEPNLALAGVRDADWRTFTAWFETLVKLAEPSIERPALEAAAVRAMTVSVKERHTGYLTAAQYEEYQAWIRGDVRYGGIGVRMRGPTLTVVDVFDGSPAQGAGVRPGDVILEIEGAATSGVPLEDAIFRIRGPRGTPVNIVVRRFGVPEPLCFTIVRDEIKVAFVRSRILAGNIGYVQLTAFPEPSVIDGVSGALASFEEAGVKGVVMDMRGNSGGRIDVGIKLTSRFVREGALYQQVDRAGRRRVTSATGGYRERSVPLVVLIDGGTASMGEIFASAVKEAGEARLIGTRTSGNVAAAQIFPLADGSAVRVTVLQIVSGRGAILNDIGVEPHEVVEQTEEDLAKGSDTQLAAAVAYIERESPGGRSPTRLPLGRASALPLAA
jgi:carboxyl-terminal processing protease